MTQVECGTVAGPGAGGAAACAGFGVAAADFGCAARRGGLAGGGGFMWVNPALAFGPADVDADAPGAKAGVGRASGCGARSSGRGGATDGRRGASEGDRRRRDGSS